jgi:CRISPR/Cas system-associated exonuclease Cas4 (RecB family)
VTDPVLTASNSSIQAFKRCRRKWWLQYALGYKPREKKVIGPLALGSRVHNALEAMYRDGEDPVVAHSRILDEERVRLMEAGADISQLEDDGDLGRIMLEGYVEWVTSEGLDEGLEVIGVEQKLTLPLYDNQVHLIGKMDLRVRTSDDSRSVLDFKTAANFSDYNLAPMFEQGPTYWILDRTSDEKDRIDSFKLRLLRKVKRTARATPPFYEEIDIRYNPFAMRNFWSRLHGVLRDMLRAQKALDAGGDPMTIVYPTPTRNCSWECDFVNICPMFDSGEAAQEMLDAEFVRGDAFAYYDTEKDV